jgi:hypothetical protein
MDNRKFQSAASATPPTAPVSPSSGYPTNGNPGTGTPATLPGEFWFHKIGEELRAIITDAGLTPSDTDLGQVLAAIKAGRRIRLAADITIYVATTGNDSTNTGLTVGSPFSTLQNAFSLLHKYYDLNGYKATIQVADGTYAVGISVSCLLVGQTTIDQFVMSGNAGTPSNVIISTTSADCILVGDTGLIKIQNLKVIATTSGYGIQALEGGRLSFSGMVFGACASGHIRSVMGGKIRAVGNYTINGSSPCHIMAHAGSVFYQQGFTVTLSGTPAFSTAFSQCTDSSNLQALAITYLGSATGSRYNVNANGVLNTQGGGANFFPGNAVGTTATGGIYV